MNQSAATAIGTVNGWVGQFRPVWSSEFRPVRIKGSTVYFKTAIEAEVVAWRTLYSVEQRVMLRSGSRIEASRCKADQLFKPIRKNGKVIPVESKRERA